ncbi:Macro domain protein [Pseudomonas phage VCM]|uniref:Macro domain protein n=1 Tax=Pseudomonas phage VCM TaxID=1729937 RepID=A0A0S4KXK8_9CAUD|nr:Macro domain protein [Pseudomonas phage VCM]CUR44365.1 Macro domain protein [Pseudomonas phage VCM]
MIQYKIGDLIDALKSGEVSSIGHQANCFNTMNSGVAKAIRLAFPHAYEADCLTVKGDKAKLGKLTCVEYERDDETVGLIYNLYGQYNYGYDAKGYTNYEALRGALLNMRIDLDGAVSLSGEDWKKVGFPKIGAGLGGGDWDTIARIIEDTFEGYDVTVYTLQ